MLYILLFIFLCIIIGAIITETNSIYPSETAGTFRGASVFLFVVTLLATIGIGVQYNSIKSTATSKLEVLNSQN